MPAPANAGPLLDWLFQRNRSQTYRAQSYRPYLGSNGGVNSAARSNGAFGFYRGSLSPSLASNFPQDGNDLAARQYAGGNARYQPYTTNYANQQAYGAPTANPSANGVFRSQNNSTLFPKCGLFGRRRGLLASNANANSQAGLAASQWQTNGAPNQFGPNAGALAANQYGTTAAYGGTGSGGCQNGWCEQTVLKYIPQIAYRTTYQAVPVTTYKTSTSINPANGLPRTCTRPCTSYKWEPRRVPYTTYRPVYTTVPITDDCGCGVNSPQAADNAPRLQPNVSGFSPATGNLPSSAGYAPRSGFRPLTSPQGGCSTCQNGTFSAMPPADQRGPWQNQPLGTPSESNFAYGGANVTPWQQSGASDIPSGNGYQATPWRPVPRARLGSDYDSRSGNTSNEYSDVPWQPVPSEGSARTRVPTAADQAPTLRNYRGDLERNYRVQTGRLRPLTKLQPVPPRTSAGPEAGAGAQPQTGKMPLFDDAQGGGAGAFNGGGFGAPYGDEIQPLQQNQYTDYDNKPLDDRLFSTPSQTQADPQSTRSDINETRRRTFTTQPIKDLYRDGSPNDDKTARSPEETPVQSKNSAWTAREHRQMAAQKRPTNEQKTSAPSDRLTRFASVPIDWSGSTRRVMKPATNEWTPRTSQVMNSEASALQSPSRNQRSSRWVAR